ncbi:hypothetical protein FJ251_03125 [bacterium]|nr:hypothetical protein [bacterium]
MAYQVAWSEQGVLVAMAGDVDIKELNEANGRLHGDPRFDGMRYQLWDLLGASLGSITRREIEQPSAIDLVAARMNARVKVALVTVSPHDVQISEHYAARSASLGSPWEIRIFSDLAAARAWCLE